MPNRACDFCSNDYKTEPSVGYYKLSNFMRIKLELNTVRADFICGLHFSPSAFSENGRLKPNTIPTFFPSQASFELDHPYFSKDPEPDTVHPSVQTYCEVGKCTCSLCTFYFIILNLMRFWGGICLYHLSVDFAPQMAVLIYHEYFWVL